MSTISGNRRPKMNYAEAAAYIGCSVRQLHDWKAKGIVPFLKLGNAVLFDADLLDRWIASKTHIPAGMEK